MAVRSVVGPTRLGVGFTLVEVLLSLALAAIVLSSMQSLIVIAGRAAPDADGPQRATVEAADALERLASEVSVAVEVTELDSHEVGFTVNDWTGDGVVETIKYGWSGTPGDPLLRAVNGGDAAVVVDGVRRFEVEAETAPRDVFISGDGEHLNDQGVQSWVCLTGFLTLWTRRGRTRSGSCRRCLRTRRSGGCVGWRSGSPGRVRTGT
jgi:prepilin-type N-terminal cleavage/methylation domain-containing protein